MPFIFIDRRKAGKGKSSSNRQRLIQRVKSFIKTSLPQNIGQGGVTGTGQGAVNNSPVKVSSSALEEPFFIYARDGERTIVLIGNDEYQRGDEIELPDEDEGNGGSGPGEHGEDDFVVSVARDEFFKVFFEDCELPNLSAEKFTDKLENKFQRAGFATTGSPNQRSIIRSYKQMIGRRRALTMPLDQELREKQKQLEQLLEEGGDSLSLTDEQALIAQLTDEISALKRRIASLSTFDEIDVVYHKREAQPLKTVDAALFMIMDISGSMGEEKKRIARRWFALLYAFIKKHYGSNTELVFIAHHDEAMEMSENDFFSTRINGGTTVSPAIALTNKIIKERYDPNQTNIYVCHASDGDNWENDNPEVINQMMGDGNLMNKIRFFSYIEVGKPWGGMFSSRTHSREDTNLWTTYDNVRCKISKPQQMSLAIIETPDECYSMFKKVFRKSR